MSTKEQKTDILEDVKRAEKKVKAKLLLKKISELKEIAYEVNKLKAKMQIILEELDVSDKDAKRVIDYINEKSEVKLSDEDKRAIKKEVREDVSDKKDTLYDGGDEAGLSAGTAMTAQNVMSSSVTNAFDIDWNYDESSQSLELNSQGTESVRLTL